MLALLLLACADPPPVDWAAQWRADPARTTQEISALGDPILREAAVVELAEAFPGQVGQLCAGLSAGPGKTRCDRLNARPHLWSVPVDASAGRQRRGRLDLSPRLVARWDEVAPAPTECAAGDGTCIETAAMAAAAGGQTWLAGGLCKAFAAPLLLQDCAFAASEAVPWGPELYAQAVPLCGLSGSYAPECHGHLLLRMRSQDPSAGGDQVPWDTLRAEAQGIRGFWQGVDPNGARLALDHYWAVVGGRVLGAVPTWPVDALDQLPPEAAPHVRSALAERAIRSPDPVMTAQQALAGTQRSLPRAADAGAHDAGRAQPWQGISTGSRPGRLIPYRDVSGATRWSVDDPETDLGLALLTASVLLGPDGRPVLEHFAAHDNATLAWAARRLSR